MCILCNKIAYLLKLQADPYLRSFLSAIQLYVIEKCPFLYNLIQACQTETLVRAA
jgi:hypothetical protein